MATGDNAATLQSLGTAKRASAVAINTAAGTKDAIEGKYLSLTGTGNAALTTFTVAHGLKTTAGVAVAPKDVVGSPRNQLSSALHWFTFDATNVTVNFVAAPSAGALLFSVLALT